MSAEGDTLHMRAALPGMGIDATLKHRGKGLLADVDDGEVITGAVLRGLPELQAPHPSFSPEGSWIVAGGTLLHLPSGDVRKLDPDLATTTALFTPEGDISAGSADNVLTRYCRSR